MGATPLFTPNLESQLNLIFLAAQQEPANRPRIEQALDGVLAVLAKTALSALSTEEIIKGIVRTRSRREKIFNSDLFRDPAWDMLLDLYISRGADRATSVTSLCIAGGVPKTTGLRFIAQLEQLDLVRRVPDPSDHRSIIVQPTDAAMAAVDTTIGYFLGRQAGAR